MKLFRICLATAVTSAIGWTAETPPPASARIKTSLEKIVEGAKKQSAERTAYSPGYVKIDYPNGDVPRDKGACTDVIIRSLRNAGWDLQRLIHEDMTANFAIYPQKWGLSKPDTNIDHRRVPNHICYMKRHATALTTETDAKALLQWQPGDLVYWKLNNGLDHCGVVSDQRSADGLPLVIHNISECCEEDVLRKWKIVAHFRMK